MEIGLNAVERMVVLGVLPQESSIVTMRITRDLSAKVGISADEYNEFGVFQTEAGVQVGRDKDGKIVQKKLDAATAVKKISFKDKELEVVLDAFKKLDDQKKIGPQQLFVYEKFDQKKEG